MFVLWFWVILRTKALFFILFYFCYSYRGASGLLCDCISDTERSFDKLGLFRNIIPRIVRIKKSREGQHKWNFDFGSCRVIVLNFSSPFPLPTLYQESLFRHSLPHHLASKSNSISAKQLAFLFSFVMPWQHAVLPVAGRSSMFFAFSSPTLHVVLAVEYAIKD